MRTGRLLLAVVTICVAGLSARAANVTQRLQGHVPEAVARWHLQPVSRVPATNQLSLALALPLRNPEALTNLLQQIYDPASTNYHRYLTPAQFTERFGPTVQDYQAVIDFAHRSGFAVTATHPNRTLLDVRGSVADIEKALHVQLNRYRHPSETRDFFAPDVEPTPDLAVPLQHISGLTDFVTPRPLYHIKARKPAAAAVPAGTGSAAGGEYLGRDFRAAYVPGTRLTGNGQTVGLIEFGSGFYQSDINAYKSLAGLPDVPVTPVLIDAYDGSAGSGNLEVSLDIEMALSMAPGLDQILVYEGPNSAAAADDILNRLATDNVARQIAASWGYGVDAGTEQVFQQFAAQGQSFFNASGDGDAWVGPIPYGACEDANITIVGGTTLATSGPGGAWVSESVWNWGFDRSYNWNPDGYVGSSGGYSTDVGLPGWQQGVDMSANHGSTSFRNVPDVALTADNIYVAYGNGSSGSVGGSSCAAPLWAGFTALVNELAVAGGRPPVGFLNPAIYSLGQGPGYAANFHDVTTGNNTWDQSLTNFFAVPGYDLCTGWGTPAGVSLINALAQPDGLQIFPTTGFAALGGVGGPFTPNSQTLTLTNSGTNALSWTSSNPAAWLNVLPAGDTLAPGTAELVTVSLTSAATNLALGTYSNLVWFINLSDYTAFGRQYTLAALAPPTITFQPGDQAVLYGATAIFPVAATGAQPLGYQWFGNGTNLVDGGNFSGSTTSVLTVSNVSPASVGPYFVTVSNAALVVTSVVAQLSITPSAPVIVQQPASQTVALGSSARFTVSADGDPPISYQWTFAGTNLPGATSASLFVTNIQFSQSGNYAVVLTNAQGWALSSNAFLTVVTGIVNVVTFDDFALPGNAFFPLTNGYAGLNWSNFNVMNAVLFIPAPPVNLSSGPGPAGNIQPLNGMPAASSGYPVGMISASNIVFNAFGSEAALSQATPFSLISAYVTAAWNDNLHLEVKGYDSGTLLYDSTYILSASTPTKIPFNYGGVTEVDFISSGGIPHPAYNGSSGTQFVMDNLVVGETSGGAINLTPVIYDFGPSYLQVAQGRDTALAVSAVGQPPLAFQWQLNGTTLTGQTNSVLQLTDVQPTMAGNYIVTVSNLFGAATSSVAAVTVVSAPLITAQPQDQLVNQADSAGFIVGILGAAPLSCQWQFQGTNISGATNAAYLVASAAVSDQGGYEVIVTNAYGSVTSRVATLTVLLSPGVSAYGNLPVVYFPSAAATNFALQMSSDPNSGNWVAVTNGIPFSGLQIPNLPATAFFRLTLAAQTVIRIAGGAAHSLFIKNDGSLWGTGHNAEGELGDGTGDDTNRPEQLVAGNVTTMSGGAGHSLFLKGDGSLWGMGYNAEGQLGDGTTYDAYHPEQIVASNVISIAAAGGGANHSLFIKNDGSLWAMGFNSSGQLGDGTENNRSLPEQIVPGNVTATSEGNLHSLFLKQDGSLWAMGTSSFGQLGDGTANTSEWPEQIMPGNVTAVAAGQWHSLFLEADGSLWAMGYNCFGELGDGTYGPSLAIGSIIPELILASNVTAIAAGGYHSLLLKSDGSLWAMGRNLEGQLGDGTFNNTNLPEMIVASNVTAIAAGQFHSLFLKRDGSLWAMGANDSGELGDGSNLNTNLPEQIVAVPELPQPVLAVGNYARHPVVLFPSVASAVNFALLMTTNLASGPWVPVANGIPFTGLQITNVPGPVFFRLH